MKLDPITKLPTKEHELKVWPTFYGPLKRGEKPFEVRVNDRSYQRGETLYLREWDPDTKTYTGESCRKLITYTLSGWGVSPGHIAMGLRDLENV